MAAPVSVERLGPTENPIAAAKVGQSGRKFTPGAVSVRVGERLTIVNDDTRTHNVRVDDPRLAVVSGAQKSGDIVAIVLPEAGAFEIVCGIHPDMRLSVTGVPR